jgi:diadenosine tetraphosphate (Ap4A) HIT family hydrolase
MDCEFCTQPEIKERTIIDTDLAFAFLTYTPVLLGHTLISPKRHVRTYGELSRSEQEAIETLRERLHIPLSESFGAQGFNYAWNEGAVAGQEVMHLHIHMVPRSEGDVPLHDPKEYLYAWQAGRPEIPQEELLLMTKDIQSRLTRN